MPGAGLFEVVIRGADGPQIYYVDERASVLVIGQAFDARSGRNLTEERMRKLSAIRWDVLPFQWAITDRRGNGRRKIAIFSDPNCPYCKRFEEDLAKLDDITVHIFPYAVIKPESVRQAKAVWCSKDRLRAWNDLMFRRIQPAAAPDCDTPVEKLVEYGRGVGASSTPTWFLETGERYSGALPLDRVRALLDTASPVKR
jgi:thiol:disulfide interchange protein DsbC